MSRSRQPADLESSSSLWSYSGRSAFDYGPTGEANTVVKIVSPPRRLLRQRPQRMRRLRSLRRAPVVALPKQRRPSLGSLPCSPCGGTRMPVLRRATDIVHKFTTGRPSQHRRPVAPHPKRRPHPRRRHLWVEPTGLVAMPYRRRPPMGRHRV